MSEISPFKDVGERFERLGKILQDPESTIADIASAAFDAGLTLQYQFIHLESGRGAEEEQ